MVEIGDFPWPPPGLSGGRRGQLLWSVCILAITGGARCVLQVPLLMCPAGAGPYGGQCAYSTRCRIRQQIRKLLQEYLLSCLARNPVTDRVGPRISLRGQMMHSTNLYVFASHSSGDRLERANRDYLSRFVQHVESLLRAKLGLSSENSIVFLDA